MKSRNELFNDFGDLLLERHSRNHQQYFQDGSVKNDSSEFGRFIRAARKNLNLTRDELAAMTALPVVTIVGIECGLIPADEIEVEWVVELAHVLDEKLVTLNLVLGREIDSVSVTEQIKEERIHERSGRFYHWWWRLLGNWAKVAYTRIAKWWRGEVGWLQGNAGQASGWGEASAWRCEQGGWSQRNWLLILTRGSVVLLTIIGFIGGLAISQSDLVNPWTSQAEAARTQTATAYQQAINEIDLQYYEQERALQAQAEEAKAREDIVYYKRQHEQSLHLQKWGGIAVIAMLSVMGYGLLISAFIFLWNRFQVVVQKKEAVRLSLVAQSNPNVAAHEECKLNCVTDVPQ